MNDTPVVDDVGVTVDPLRPGPLWLIDTAGKDWIEQRTDFDPGGSLNNMHAFQFDPSTFNSNNALHKTAQGVPQRRLNRELTLMECASRIWPDRVVYERMIT